VIHLELAVVFIFLFEIITGAVLLDCVQVCEVIRTDGSISLVTLWDEVVHLSALF
jgi:hypothetical protein